MSSGTLVAFERVARHDIRELGDRVSHLALGVEEVRAEPDASERVRPEVADDPALAELLVAGGVVRGRDGDRAAPSFGRSWRDDLEARLVAEVDQKLRERERALADPWHADLLDHVVAGRCRIERGHVRRAGEEASSPRGVLELRFEGERPRVALPPDECGLEPLGDVRPHVEPAGAGAAAEPLDTAA